MKMAASIVIAVITIAGLIAGFAQAQTSGVSFTVSPVSLGLSGKPGQQVSGKINVVNGAKTALRFSTTVEPISEAKPEDSAVSFIRIEPESFSLPPGGVGQVTVTVVIPAREGESYAMALIGVPPPLDMSKRVATYPRIAVRVFVGNGVKAAKLSGVQARWKDGRVQFRGEFHNIGTANLKPEARFLIMTADGKRELRQIDPTLLNLGTIYPGQSRSIDLAVEIERAPYLVRLIVNYGAKTMLVAEINLL